MITNKIKPWRFLSLATALVAAFTFSSCDDENEPLPPTNNLVDVAKSNPNFSVLVNAVEEANLVLALSSPGPFTVFAPNNTAFQTFLSENNLTAQQLLANPDLEDILGYHVVAGAVASSSISAGSVTNLTPQPFFVSEDVNGGLWINGNAQVVNADIAADNGIIHELDRVIVAPSQNIAQIAVGASTAANPEFTQLVAALQRANLVEALSGDFSDNFTVFAPTDAAFEALYEDLGVNGVDEIAVDLLTNVLLYHVVPARAFSQDLRQDAILPTLLENESLTVDLANLQINESGLIASSLNIHATNGVVHAIDRVLLPPMANEISAVITLSNVGATAYRVDSIDGEGASATLGANNTGITLTAGLRYTFVNNGGTNHPLDFRNAAGEFLLTENATAGSFENNEAVNFVVEGSSISFTLTPELAAVLATYNCSRHSAMVGTITVN